MSFLDLRKEILDADLCASCGACVAVCPQDLLHISVDQPIVGLKPGAEEQEPGLTARCGSCSLCVDVCPGREPRLAESEIHTFGRVRSRDEQWTGISRSTFLARATEQATLNAASAGGAATALLITALRTGSIDAALVVGRDVDRPWVPVPRIVTTEAELLECAQASYAITPNLQLLRDTPHERIGVVGLACQMLAVNRMRAMPQPPTPVEKVALLIEIACSSNTSLDGTRHLIEDRLNLPVADVTRMKYREGPYPGNFTVSDAANRSHSLPFHELVVAFKDFKPFRCEACPDWWSGLADISISDGDPNIFRTSRNQGEAVKNSLVMTRTSGGEDLVALAVSRGELEAETTVFEAEKNLGLQRKINRFRKYRQRFPDRVPVAPLVEGDPAVVLTDGEVIERLSPKEDNNE